MQARHWATDSVDGRSVSFIIDTSSGSPPTETSASRKPVLAARRSLCRVYSLAGSRRSTNALVYMQQLLE